MWVDLEEDIASEFARLEGCVDVGVDLVGLRRHDFLNTSRLTTKEAQTPEQKAKKRQELEANRRQYKAMKAREYYARKKAA